MVMQCILKFKDVLNTCTLLNVPHYIYGRTCVIMLASVNIIKPTKKQLYMRDTALKDQSCEIKDGLPKNGYNDL